MSLQPYVATQFTPEPFVPSNEILKLHQFTRFGHTNDIGAFIDGLTDGNEEMKQNYLLGVTAGAMLVLSIGLFLFIVLMGVKCAGPKKVGFLAGRLYHPDYDPTSPDLIDEDRSSGIVIDGIDPDSEDAKNDEKFKKKVIAVRLIFVISGLAVILCVSLFYGKGMAAFRLSLDNTSQGLQLIDETTNEAMDILNAVKTDTNMLLSDFFDMKTGTGGEICNGESEYAQGIRDKVTDVERVINEFKEPLDANVDAIVNELSQITASVREVETYMEKANIFFAVTIAISIIIGLLIFGVLVVAYFSYREVSNKCTKLTTYAMLWPAFIFFLILFFVFALLFLVASLAAADFCYDPDEIVETFLNRRENSATIATEKMALDYGIYYVSGCQSQNQPSISAMDTVTDYLNEINSYTGTYRNIPPILIAPACGLTLDQARALHEGLGQIYEASIVLNEDVINALELIECKTMNPIYTTFVHTAVCTDGIDGLSWIFASSLFLVVFSIILFMFRAAMYPVKMRNMIREMIPKRTPDLQDPKQGDQELEQFKTFNDEQSKQVSAVDGESPEKESFTDIIRPVPY